MRLVTHVVIAAVVVTQAACSTRAARDDARPSPAVAEVCKDRPGAAGYAIAGKDVTNAELRPLTLCPLSLGPAIGQPRVSWISGASGRTVVAEMSGRSDTVREVVNGKYAAVPGLGTPPGHSPALAADGKLLWQVQDTSDGAVQFVLRMFDPATQRATELLRSRTPLSGPAWGPAGEIAVIDDLSGASSRLLVLDKPGSKPRAIYRPSRDAVGVLWSPAGDLFVQQNPKDVTTTRAVILDRRGQRRAEVPSPWIVLGIASDGAVIVARHDTGDVAVLHQPNYDAPAIVGRLDVPLWGAAIS